MTTAAERDALIARAQRIASVGGSLLSNASLLVKQATGLTVDDEPTPGPVPDPAPGPVTGVQRTDIEGSTPAPVMAGGVLTALIPAMTSPPTPRRAEAVWAVPDLTEGQTVRLAARVTPTLGAVAAGDRDWHVLTQLQGQTSRGFVQPAVALVVRHGQWRIQGGGGAPVPAETAILAAPYTDGRAVDLVMEVLVSADPALGWVSLTLDGQTVVDHARLKAGTRYADQPAVGIKSGLYRGTDPSGVRPTYAQSVVIEHPSITVTSP